MISGEFSSLAFARGDKESARIVAIGVPYDSSAFQPGARFGPNAIRLASWNLEDYILDLGGEIDGNSIYDAGNIPMQTKFEELIPLIEMDVGDIVCHRRYPIIMGGVHAITPICVRTLRDIYQSLGVVILDAHLDFRNEYLGDEWSHACTVRRISEIIGVENIIMVGVRSACRDEAKDAERMALQYITAEDVNSMGVPHTLDILKNFIGTHDTIYLSIDMDVIDPGFAPGVGTPEPYGLNPRDVRKIIEYISSVTVAMDIVEVLGLNCGGDLATSMIGAEFIRRFIYLKQREGV